MPKSSSKIFIDPVIGEVTFRKSARIKGMSIRVHPVKGVTVTMPFIVPYAAAQLFLHARREWVMETLRKQKEKLENVHVPSEGEVEQLRKMAKSLLPPRLATLASRYGFVYNRVSIKHNASNWGSCSSKGNINLNLNIVRLPGVLQDYVLLHELCHLRHQDHGHAYHLLLEHVLTDHIVRLMNEGEGEPAEEREMVVQIARKAAVSKAKYPLDYTITRLIKKYTLI